MSRPSTDPGVDETSLPAVGIDDAAMAGAVSTCVDQAQTAIDDLRNDATESSSAMIEQSLVSLESTSELCSDASDMAADAELSDLSDLVIAVVNEISYTRMSLLSDPAAGQPALSEATLTQVAAFQAQLDTLKASVDG